MLSARANLDQVRGEYERYTDLAARGLVSEAMFEGLRYDVEALEASYELAKLNFDYSKIRAPIDGIVSARDIKLGQSVAAEDIVFRITDTSELLAYLQIPQAELAKFAVGHTAILRVDAMPETEYTASIGATGRSVPRRLSITRPANSRRACLHALRSLMRSTPMRSSSRRRHW